MAEDDDGLDPARITRLLEQKVGADGRTVRDQAPPELVELVVRKRERRKEALKKAKKEERRLEAQQKTRAIEADEEEETDGVEEEEEGAGEDSGHVSRLLGWATARAGDMWDGLQGADTTLAEERVAKHMQRKSRATAAPAMRALAEEEEGEEEEGTEAGPSTMTMATAVEEEVAWWQKDAHWQSLGCDLPSQPSSQPHPLLRPQSQHHLQPEPQPQPNLNFSPNPSPSRSPCPTQVRATARPARGARQVGLPRAPCPHRRQLGLDAHRRCTLSRGRRRRRRRRRRRCLEAAHTLGGGAGSAAAPVPADAARQWRDGQRADLSDQARGRRRAGVWDKIPF